jgi:hypothetical protein
MTTREVSWTIRENMLLPTAGVTRTRTSVSSARGGEENDYDYVMAPLAGRRTAGFL